MPVAALILSLSLQPSMLTSQLDHLLSVPDLQGAIVCATVSDEAGQVIYSHSGDLLVAPASNEKLYSAAFALWELGPDYKSTTAFYKLADRMVVDSPGDPALSHEQLRGVARDLDLSGSLPVYVKEPYSAGFVGTWELGDLPNRYAAPVSGFEVDQSGFDLWNRGGQWRLEPSAYGVNLMRNPRSAVGNPQFTYDPLRRTLEVRGLLPKKDDLIDTLSVPDADAAAASLLGHYAGRASETPSGPPAATVDNSLLQTISTCLHRSDNNMAENLLLMGAAHEGPFATPEEPYREALRRLKNFESRIVGIPDWQTLPRDGSGLTRSNFTTTGAIATLLAWANRQPTAVQFKTSLASPGSGTLRRRLAGVKFFGKTGSLSNVTALSGYLETRTGKRLIASIIINSYRCSEERAVGAVDSFLRFLSESAL